MSFLKSSLKKCRNFIIALLGCFGMVFIAIGSFGYFDNDPSKWIKVHGSIEGSTIERKIINRSLIKYTSRNEVSVTIEGVARQLIIDYGSADSKMAMQDELNSFAAAWDGFVYVKKNDYSRARLSLENPTGFVQLLLTGVGLIAMSITLTVFIVMGSSRRLQKT